MQRTFGPLAVLLAFTACSFSASAPRKDYNPSTHGRPDCTREAPGRAVLDGLWAGAYMFVPVGVAGAVVSGEATVDELGELGAPVAVLTLLAAFHAGAIAHAGSATAKCERAYLEYARWYSDREASR